jgi:hypothetical protein
MNKLLISILLLMSSALYGQVNTMVPFKLLKAEGIKLESYYLKADQSSEIAQTRYHRGLYLMSELSALRARLQFEKADDSIDEYVSKVAGTNLGGVLPWNRKKYKQELMDDALKLRFSLASQEEDLEALLKEIQQQLVKSNSLSAQRTLERMDNLINELFNKSNTASPNEREKYLEAVSMLEETKQAIHQGIEEQIDITDLIKSASKLVDGIELSNIAPIVANKNADYSNGKNLSVGNTRAGTTESLDQEKYSPNLTFADEIDPSNLQFNNGQLDKSMKIQNNPRINSGSNEKTQNTNDFKFVGGGSEQNKYIQLPNGRKVRVSRPPIDWPNGKAVGHDSIYDDRPGGNLIKEEEILFERIDNSSGNYEIKEVSNSQRERRWNFRIKESGGFDDKYSLANTGNEVDFEIKRWTLMNSSREVVERLDGNNLHFNPENLSEGDYSIEVEGVTDWQSPFTVVASVLR